MQEVLKIPEGALEHKKEITNEKKLEIVKPEKERAADKNDEAKELMATELTEMGLTPQAISRLLNLKN